MNEVLLIASQNVKNLREKFLELNGVNVHDRYLQFIASTFKFYNNQCPDYFHEVFCPFDDNEVATSSCNKKIEINFSSVKIRNAKFIVRSA